jgi:hypothetical protein
MGAPLVLWRHGLGDEGRIVPTGLLCCPGAMLMTSCKRVKRIIERSDNGGQGRTLYEPPA